MNKATRMETVTMIDEDHVGKAKQAAGQAQGLYGQIVDQVRKVTAVNPLGALWAAMGIRLAFGLLTPRRESRASRAAP